MAGEGIHAGDRGVPLKTLTVNKIESAGGSGKVTSEPAGIFCSADCTEDYVKYTAVTLTAHPGLESYFVGWSGDCPDTGPTIQVAMDDHKTCTATFGYPVGGVVVPVNKLGLLAPWMRAAAVALAGLTAWWRRVGKRLSRRGE